MAVRENENSLICLEVTAKFCERPVQAQCPMQSAKMVIFAGPRKTARLDWGGLRFGVPHLEELIHLRHISFREITLRSRNGINATLRPFFEGMIKLQSPCQ